MFEGKKEASADENEGAEAQLIINSKMPPGAACCGYCS